MFTKNRVLVIHDEDLIIVHLNGLEIATIYESWDSIDAIEEIIKAIDKLSDKQRQRRFSFTVVDEYSIEIDDIAKELLYEVKQFTQEEEKALMTNDWEALEKLLLQRAEDDVIE
mgnify:CR=1 FL=1